MLTTLLRDRKGSISVLGALSLTSIVGGGAMVVELGNGYVARTANQRVADMAALSAALAYSDKVAAGMTATNQLQAVVDAQVDAIGGAAGIPADRITAHIDAVPGSETAKRIVVVATTRVPLRLARVLNRDGSYPVSSTGSVDVSAAPSTPPSVPPVVGCYMGMKSGVTGISLTGGTNLTASGCGVVTNGSISVTAGPKLIAKDVSAGGTVNDVAKQWGTGGISTTSGGNYNVKSGQAQVTDPLANYTPLNDAFNQLKTPSAFRTPVVPAVPNGNDLTLDWSGNINFKGTKPTWSNNTYTFPAGTYNFKNVTLPGGMKLVFQGPTNITVSGTLNQGGGSDIIIGDGPVTLANSFTMNAAVTMGTGAHSFGGDITPQSFTLTLGAGDVNIAGGINQGGGGTIVFGAGNYAIGKLSGSANSINQGGGSRLTFGNGTFSLAGDVTTAGGTSLTFGDTAYHYIKGSLNLSGSVTFGKGFYIIGTCTVVTAPTTCIGGNFNNGTGGYMYGTDTTFILGGTVNLSGGTSLSLSAPKKGSLWGIIDILFATRSSAASKISGGSGNSYNGTFYAPNSDFTLDGGGSLTSPTNGCLMMLFGTLTLSGGTNSASACTDLINALPPTSGTGSGSGSGTSTTTIVLKK
ncbi:hypothetical protein [Sphingomonas sp. ID0503]|uniref:hypothetical protein n=1 Tax=Sphingomonas sp. ID0503 TaxID=3399691 RepID=UPI003AFB24BB